MKNLKMAFMLALPFASTAQTPGAGPNMFFENGNFFECVIGGILLALAFQLILTALSIAGGISAVGDLKKKSSTKNKSSHTDDSDGMNIGQKISTGYGIWTMITTSVALFFASLLAVQMGLIQVDFVGLTLGLIIWAAFFIIIMYLEFTALSSITGGLVSVIKNGFGTASSAFSTSEAGAAKQVAKTSAQEQAKQMRKEFQKLFDTNDVDKKVNEYVEELKPQKIDINNLKKQIKDLFTDMQVTEKPDAEHPETVKKMILEETDSSFLSKEDKQAVKDHVSGLKNIGKSDDSNQEKVKKGVEEMTAADRDQINQYQDKIKKALESTHKDELKPEQLEEDIQKIMNEPGKASNILKAKATALDRQSLIKIASSQGMDEREAENYATKIEGVLNKVTTFFNDKKEQASSKKGGIESQIKSLFSGNGNGDSSLDIKKITSDFTSIFKGSGSGEELQYKLKHYNEDEMTDLIAEKTGMNINDSKKVAEAIIAARDGVLEKAEQIEAKVEEKMQEAKEKSLAAAEETRKAAAAAAWWLVGTAIVSAVASAAGGYFALEGWFL